MAKSDPVTCSVRYNLNDAKLSNCVVVCDKQSKNNERFLLSIKFKYKSLYTVNKRSL